MATFCNSWRTRSTRGSSLPSQADQSQVTPRESSWHYLPGSVVSALPIQLQQLKGYTRYPCSCLHPLSLLNITQGEADLAQSTTAQRRARNHLQQDKQKHGNQAAATLYDKLPKPLQRARKVASEKGASSWLTALPLQHHGFAIHKVAFRDALALRYKWALERLPSHCVCGKPCDANHVLNCPTGGFPTAHDNDVQDLLTEHCRDMAIEPVLQPITEETFQLRSTSTDNGAGLDIQGRGLWGIRSESAFFDVRIFNPNSPSNHTSSSAACYRRHKQAKRNLYEERIHEVERALFTPLVFTTSG